MPKTRSDAICGNGRKGEKKPKMCLNGNKQDIDDFEIISVGLNGIFSAGPSSHGLEFHIPVLVFLSSWQGPTVHDLYTISRKWSLFLHVFTLSFSLEAAVWGFSFSNVLWCPT